ncbi:class II histone deacetylase [Chromohalobacter israelensis]|uniref:class II histone deacetylase n=1 Tax=Chromohalobacter israelensis TaxID=141390 RepID=UPI0015C4BED2|nr:class II histone deacetylase [Chromohalobacter salexigens]NWO57331.1 class II histone deacetylase [Chromohalobacter salexigens]
MKPTTGFLYHEICMWHDPGPRSVYDASGLYFQPERALENPETKRRLRNLLEVSGVLDGLTSLKAAPAQIEDLLRFHTPDYIERLQSESAKGPGDAGDGAPFARGGFDIACQSAGMAMRAVEAVMTGEVDNAYSLGRPPGHHAVSHQGLGFCLLGNIPIAILSAQAKGVVKRVAVVDWDVHHGNGTQEAFYQREDVLTISIHHDNNFPLDSGGVEEAGERAGEGYNLNIPLPAGSGIGAYHATLDELVIPALERFRPELIVVASGFDAAAMDPLGPMILNSQCYRDMTHKLMAASNRLCQGRLVFVHEGGYSEGYVPFCGLAVLEALSDQESPVVDTLGDEISHWGQQALQPHQRDIIESIKPCLDRIRPPL